MTQENPVTIEWFESNCSLLEKNLSVDLSDPVSHLGVLRTWVDWVEGNSDSQECVVYFYDVSLLKIVTSLLTRKYQNNDTHIAAVKDFLFYVSASLGKQLLEYGEYVTEILLVLFNPRQPFYLKYGYPEHSSVDSQQALANTSKNVRWQESLGVGDCIDGLAPGGMWEIVIIDEVSPVGTEFYVTWSSGEQEWLSADNLNRVARFGTRTGVYSGEGSPPPPPPVNTGPDESATMASWRARVQCGDLIDAKDKTGIWYQACVMETREVECRMEEEEKANANTAKTGDRVLDVEREAVEIMKEELFAMQAKNAQDIATPGPSYAGGAVSNADLPPPVPDREGKYENNGGSPVDITPPPPPSSSPMLVSDIVIKTYARVAYLGWLEWSDDWIDLSAEAGRVAPLNTFSHGARGEYFVREEIKHVAGLWEKRAASVDPDMDGNICFAFSCCPALVSPVFADMVQRFGEGRGFFHMLLLLRNQQQVSLACLLKLLICIGGTAEVLSHQLLKGNVSDGGLQGDGSFCGNFCHEFIVAGRESLTILLTSQSHLRSTNTDVIEQVLLAMESIMMATIPDRMQSAQQLDLIWFTMSRSCIRSPYLNRRLGGLKMLTDLVQRSETHSQHPSGIRITRSPAPTSSGTATTGPGLEMVSYTVVRPCSYDPESLCKVIAEHVIIPSLFVGETAHEALMQRSTEILKFMARHRHFGESDVRLLWETGYGNKVAPALQALGDLVPKALDTSALSVLAQEIDAIPSKEVTPAIVDMLAAIAMRCRDVLMRTCPATNEANINATPPSDSCSISNASDTTIAMLLHDQCLRILWGWAEDGAGVLDDVFSKCVSKIEAVLELGCSQGVALGAGNNFPWSMQWERGHNILDYAVTAIKRGKSVNLAIKTIRASVLAWLKDDSDIFDLSCEGTTLPFTQPLRCKVAEYLEGEFGILEAVTTVVIHLKKRFNEVSRDIAIQAHDCGNSTSIAQLHVALNEMRVGDSRNGYKSQLEACFDFIHFFLRCSSEICLGFDAIQDIWNMVLLKAVTPQERDLVFGFLSRLLVNRAGLRQQSTRSSALGNIGMEEKVDSGREGSSVTHIASKFQRRVCFCAMDTVGDIFRGLLCRDEFISSEHLSPQGFLCMEKFFRWICSSKGYITDLSGKDGGFVLHKSLSMIDEWEVFLKVLMMCRDDKVASSAVKFLTMFPQRLADHLVWEGDLESVRHMMLSRCMSELGDLRNETMSSFEGDGSVDIVIADKKRLYRTLMFLNAILDESMADAGRRVKPHSGHYMSKTLTVRIQGGQKGSSTVTVNSNDSVEDFMHQVASAVDKQLSQVKLFRNGAEMVVGSCRRTVQQIGLSSNEVILVAERPAPAQKQNTNTERDTTDTDTASLPTSSKPYQCSLKSLPAVVLSNTPEYLEILFSLSDITTGSLCDDIWGLITRLPTSPCVLQGWRDVISGSCDTNSSSRMPIDLFGLHSDSLSCSATVSGKRIRVTKSLSRLLYNMQVVALFLHADSDDSTPMCTEEEDNNWVTMFFAMGGVVAVADAIGYISFQLDRYLERESVYPCCGVTPKLLLCASNLATKIFRSIMIRNAVCFRGDFVIQLHDLLKVITRQGKNISSNKNSAPISVNANANSSGPTSAGVCEEDSASEVVVCGDSEDACLVQRTQDEIFASEWGNRLNLCLSMSTDDPVGGAVNLCEIQHLVCRLLYSWRQFSLESTFYLDDSCGAVLSQRQAVQAAQDEHLNVLCNCFVIWLSAVTLNPDVVYSVVYKDNEEDGKSGESPTLVPSTTFLKSLLIGYQLLDLKPDSVMKKSYLASLTSTVAVEGIFAVVRMSFFCGERRQDIRNCGSSLSPCEHLLGTLMRAILHLKPSIFVREADEDVRTAPEGMELSADALFALSSRLMSLRPAVGLGVPQEGVLNICEGIFSELNRAVFVFSHAKRPCSALYKVTSGLRYISGTIGLLVNLASEQPSVLSALYESGIVRFVIFSCVGIVPRHEITLNVLCDNADSGRQAYNALRMYFSNTRIVQSIADTVHDAHATLDIPSEWFFNPERDMRSNTGYVGLKNMGCTCYMNSLLQILYMMPSVRRGILQAKTTEDEEAQRDDLVYQLKNMFGFLRHSTRRAFSPDSWVYAYKDETGLAPINVVQQQDAQEFLQVLCERVEGVLLVKNDQGSAPLMQCAFGGRLCDQMLKNDGDGFPSDVREKEEEFVCISLDVRGTKGLENSLNKFVSGETISDFLWEEGHPRVNIIKRQCLSELSDSVIFHLKRFELNFDTFLREKVNDEFPFPSSLDLFPYSKEGLAGVPLNQSEKPEGYYQFELSAVVVHTGTTDSGHYFSYIRESVEDAKERQWREAQCFGTEVVPNDEVERRWIEFDDSEVRPFSDVNIPAECFGGTTMQHEYVVSSQTWSFNNIPNPKSAYMLVYTRINSKFSSHATMDDLLSLPPAPVVLDNQTHLLSHRVYSSAHMEFIASLYDKLLDTSQLLVQNEEKKHFLHNVRRFLSFVIDFAARSSNQSATKLFEDGCDRILAVLEYLQSSSMITDSGMIQSKLKKSSTMQSADWTAPLDSGDQMDAEGEHSASSNGRLPSPVTSCEDLEMEEGGEDSIGIIGDTVCDDDGVHVQKSYDAASAPLFCVEVCTALLSDLLVEDGKAIRALLFAPEKNIRMSFARLLHKAIVLLLEKDPIAAPSILSVPDYIMKTDVMSPFSAQDIPQPTSTQDSAESANVSVCVSLLLLLTRNSLFLATGEQWRRANAHTWLLSSLSCHPLLCTFFVKREVVMQLVDLFLAESSPLCGELYPPATRKRAPTSYVSLIYDKDGKLPSSAQYIPDWTYLMEALANLVCSVENSTIHSTQVRKENASVLDLFSRRCARSRMLITHALKQARYCRDVNRIIAHEVFDDLTFTNDVAEALVESISFASNDATAHLFRSLEAFLLVEDGYQMHRASVLLDGESGLLVLMKSNTLSKPTFVCILMHSLFSVALKVQSLRSCLSVNRAKISEWAPWVLKFCFQFCERSRKEAQMQETSDQTRSGNTGVVKTKTGPFIEVYGELEEHRTSTWLERAERTFLLVQRVLQEMGEVPDTLIPHDAFEEDYSSLGTTADTAMNLNDDNFPALIDEVLSRSEMEHHTEMLSRSSATAMSDEDIARYLSKM